MERTVGWTTRCTWWTSQGSKMSRPSHRQSLKWWQRKCHWMFCLRKNQVIHKRYVNHRCVRRTTTWTWVQPVWITSPHRLPIVTWRVKWRISKVILAWKVRRKVSIAKRKKWKSFSWAQWAGNTELFCIIWTWIFQWSGWAVFLQPAMPATILRPTNVGILC